MEREAEKLGRDTLVISIIAFAFGAMFAWALTSGSSRWLANVKDLPAWVQAVGSILAILVAIAVPAWQRGEQHRESKRVSQLRARSLASVTLYSIQEFQTGVRRALQDLAWHERSRQDGGRISFGIPEGLWKHIDRLHLLGAPGGHVLSALYIRSTLNELRDAQEYIYREQFPEFRSRLESVHSETRAALDGIHKLMTS